METSNTNFVKQYEPDDQARVELQNGRILDVVNGRYFEAGTSIVLQDGGIMAMPGLADAGINPDQHLVRIGLVKMNLLRHLPELFQGQGPA